MNAVKCACIIVAIFFLFMLTWKHRYSFLTVSNLVPFYYKRIYDGANNKPFTIVQRYNVNPEDKNIISASIYGTNPIYYNGLDKVIQLVMDKYKNWRMRVYCHDKAPPQYINKLISNPHIQVFIVHDEMVIPGNSAGAFWRFMPLSEEGINFISVDADDDFIIFPPEVLDKWLMSDKDAIRAFLNLHFFYGKTHVCAKYFGCKSTIKMNPHEITHYKLRDRFGSDELFLSRVLYPLMKGREYMYYTDTMNKLIYMISIPKNFIRMDQRKS